MKIPNPEDNSSDKSDITTFSTFKNTQLSFDGTYSLAGENNKTIVFYTTCLTLWKSIPVFSYTCGLEEKPLINIQNTNSFSQSLEPWNPKFDKTYTTSNEENRRLIPVIVKQTVEYYPNPPLASTCGNWPIHTYSTSYESYYYNSNINTNK